MGQSARARLLLVRSGATEWDALGRVQGATDLPLCEQGIHAVQARIADLLEAEGGTSEEDFKLDRVICAPDEGSRQTAKLITQASGISRATSCKDLGEMALGLWEGLRYQELEERYCRAGRLFLEDPSGVQAPEGEALEGYVKQIVPAVGKLVSKMKTGSSSALILRPIALGVIRCVLNNQSVCQLWSMINDRPDMEWYTLPSDDAMFTSFLTKCSRLPAHAAA